MGEARSIHRLEVVNLKMGHERPEACPIERGVEYVLFVMTGYEHKVANEITRFWRVDGLQPFVPMYDTCFGKRVKCLWKNGSQCRVTFLLNPRSVVKNFTCWLAGSYGIQNIH